LWGSLLEGKTVGLIGKEDGGCIVLVERAIRAAKAMMAKRETTGIERSGDKGRVRGDRSRGIDGGI
jgi:hypothetical protein